MTPTRARIPTRKPRDQPAGKKTSRANFARRTVAYRTLKELFDTGELTGMESPSAVYNMHDVFKKYNIDQFRTGFNNFKSDFLPRNDSDNNVLNTRSTQDDGNGEEEDKAVKMEAGKDDGVLDDLFPNIREQDCETVASYWGANYIMSHWIEPVTTISRLNVAVLLPSGAKENNFKVGVLPHGRVLEVSVNFPPPLINMKLLHKYFMARTSTYDPAEVSLGINGFEKSLKSRREHMESDVVNTTQVILPFKVSTDFSYHYLGWAEDTTLVVYVKLHSHRDSYAHVGNIQKLERA